MSPSFQADRVQADSFQAVPVVDLSPLRGPPEERARCAALLRETCARVGFFYARGHGLPEGKLARVLELAAALFAAPAGEKQRLHLSRSPHFRGYSELGGETTLGLPDHKESFDLGLEQPARPPDEVARLPFLRLQGPNQWPDESGAGLQGFRAELTAYLGLLGALGRELLGALEPSLTGLATGGPDAYAMLRLHRYPPVADPQGFGVGPHTDAGWLVLLLQDDVGGLQVQNPRGEWLDVPPVPGTLVVNIGESLREASGGTYAATPHRVRNHPSRVRHSVPFFFEPDLTAQTSPGHLYGERMWAVFQRSFARPAGAA